MTMIRLIIYYIIIKIYYYMIIKFMIMIIIILDYVESISLLYEFIILHY